MPGYFTCNTLVSFDEFGYGRMKVCSACGNHVRPETAYQKTARCRAVACRKCRRSIHPLRKCRCTVEDRKKKTLDPEPDVAGS